MTSVLREIIDERRRLGIDRWDEMWEGVLHMSPAPGPEHARITKKLIVFLDPLVERKGLGLVTWTNVREPGSDMKNYRVPDLLFVSNVRAHLVGDAWIDGGPDVVFEVHSPGDDTYKKFGFYAKVGVEWLVVIHRDTKRVEVYRRADADHMEPVVPASDGSVAIEPLTVAIRSGARGTVDLWDLDVPSARVTI